jgi:hypothetical protein
LVLEELLAVAFPGRRDGVADLTGVGAALGLGHARTLSGRDVAVHPEEVVGVVPGLDATQALVVLAVGVGR